MKNKKGFTLIELLAVIAILGLLMAIAIPSVTKYIQQSRVKTLIDSINVYEESAVTLVNDNYFGSLSDSDYIYFIPIECIPIEKGGTDPFGDWGEAYVGVHYNAEEYSYEYYFTFYDKSGYGMKLTKIDEISYSSIENPTTLNHDNIVFQQLGSIKPKFKNCCDTGDAIKFEVTNVSVSLNEVRNFWTSSFGKEETKYINAGNYKKGDVSLVHIYYSTTGNFTMYTLVNPDYGSKSYEYGILFLEGCTCGYKFDKYELPSDAWTWDITKYHRATLFSGVGGAKYSDAYVPTTTQNSYIRTYKKNKTTGEITYGTMYYIESPYYYQQ